MRELFRGPMGMMQARLGASALALEAFGVFFGTLAASGSLVARHGAGVVWGIGLGLTLLCLVAAAFTRRPGGMIIGVVTQLLLLAAGTTVYGGLFVVVMFIALWLWLMWVGAKADRFRAGLDQAHRVTAPDRVE